MHRDRNDYGRARRTAVTRLPAALLAGTCLSTSRLALAGLLAAGALLAALPADGASFSAGNEAQLRSAIDNARNGDTIVLTANIALTANLPVLSHSVTIDGRNFTLSGNGQFRGLFLESGSVSIDNLTIADTTSQGGHGGLGMFGGGSGGAGGAGLGGALFVGAAAHLTVGNVTLRDNQARGGNGAAKSSAHESGTSGGGGGYYPTGANGGDGGSVFSGGGGTGNGGDGSTNGKGSNGGFGGGGGGGHGGGGNGGFGGGGGGSPGGTVQGSEGFLGGAGGLFVGGGGAGLGGAIFVQQGGTITLTGELNVSGSTVQGGAGIPNGHDKPGDPGRAAGAGLFLHGNGTLTFSPGASQTQQVADAIVDATGAGGTGANAGSWSVVKTGAGTAILTGQNAYSGATVVSGGTLQGTSTSLRGNITNNASLVFDQPGTGTYSGSISGTGSLTKAGAGTLSVTGTNTHSGGTAITGGALLFGSDASLGAPGTHIDLNGGSIGPASGFQANNRPVTLTGRGGFVTDQGELSWTGVISGTGTLVKSGQHPLSLGAVNTYAGGTAVEGGQLRFTSDANLGAAGTGITLSGGGLIGTLDGSAAAMSINRPITLSGGGGGILVALHPLIWSGAIGGEGQLVKTGPGVLQLTGANTYAGGTRVELGTLQVASDDKLGAAGTRVTLVNNGGLWATESFATARPITLSEPGGVFQLDAGRTLTLTGTIDGGILGTVGTGTLVLSGTSSYAGISNNGGTIQGNTATLRGNIAFDTNADNPNARSVIFDQASDGTFSGTITGLGSVANIGGGTLTLAGDNTYSRGTTVSAGTLRGTTRSLQGAIASSAAVIFDQTFDGAYAGSLSGSGTLAKNGTGRVNLTGTSSVGGGTTINAGALAVNGHLTSNVVINRNGTLAGSGNVTGNIVVNGGTIEPGNSIGHLTIDGNFTFNSGTYGVELDARGDSDRISVVGAGHTVTIRAGTLQVLPEAGTYVPGTTYTIVTSAGGGTVEFDTIAGGVGFLTPRVWFEHDRVQLALVLAPNAFRSAGQTPNQQAVGSALDAAASGGNVSGLVTAMANLPTAQGAPALHALSGQPWADFGTVNIRAGQLFMNAIGRQVAIDRGAGPGATRSVALAEACVATCDVDAGTDTPPRLSAWLSGIGSTGSVLGDGNAGGLGYTLGGAAFGIGYRPDPRFLVGIAGGWLGGQQWVNGFAGNGYTDSLSVALYGSFAPGGPRGGFYADALAGYANASNRMQRIVSLPGLPTGIASGSTTASQFLGQVETGYRLALGAAGSPLGNTSISPFARLQIGSSTQAAFGESGSSLFNLSVAQQTTTSVRTTVGADLATRLDLGRGTPLDIGLRLGWMHELADTARPMTAAFAAAPGGQFTVLGATPQRDSALIGFSAAAALNERLSLFASYDGELGGGTDSHQLRVGFRLTW